MAIFHLSVKLISRSKGRSVIAAAAYRHALRLQDARAGLTHDYRAKDGVEHSEVLAPAESPAWVKDRAQLWNTVEGCEKRRDAQLAREIEVALPAELTLAQRVELIRHWAKEQLVGRGMVADIALHAPGGEGDNRNFHAHIMITLRSVSGAGFGPKNRTWSSREMLRTWRESWAETCNQHLAMVGCAERIDHRSLAAQGIDRQPTIKRGQKASAMDRRAGEVLSDRGSIIAAIGRKNVERRRQRLVAAKLLRQPWRVAGDLIQDSALDLTSPDQERWQDADPLDQLLDEILGHVPRAR